MDNLEILVDSAGNEYLEGAIVRMYHFATRRKKYYMYKQVSKVDLKNRVVYFNHLPIADKKEEPFNMKEGFLKKHTLIVQMYYDDMRELRRNKYLSD